MPSFVLLLPVRKASIQLMKFSQASSCCNRNTFNDCPKLDEPSGHNPNFTLLLNITTCDQCTFFSSFEKSVWWNFMTNLLDWLWLCIFFLFFLLICIYLYISYTPDWDCLPKSQEGSNCRGLTTLMVNKSILIYAIYPHQITS